MNISHGHLFEAVDDRGHLNKAQVAPVTLKRLGNKPFRLAIVCSCGARYSGRGCKVSFYLLLAPSVLSVEEWKSCKQCMPIAFSITVVAHQEVKTRRALLLRLLVAFLVPVRQVRGRSISPGKHGSCGAFEITAPHSATLRRGPPHRRVYSSTGVCELSSTL